MERHIFDREILGLFKYFQRKNFPDDSTTNEWFLMLKKLPNNAFEKAIRKLKDKDKLPFNMPKAIKTAWFDYTKDHPKKIVKNGNYVKCLDCNSSGGFYVLLYNGKLQKRVQYLVLCSECNNWMKIASNQVLKRKSAEELIQKKIPFKPYNQVLPVLWDYYGYIDGIYPARLSDKNAA